MSIFSSILESIVNFIKDLTKREETSSEVKISASISVSETSPVISKPPVVFNDLNPQNEVKFHIPMSTKLLVYKITSAFEGAIFGQINFENITADFDGQGLSIGFLQWCTGQGSDLALFKMMLQNHPNQMKESFGDLFDEFAETLSLDTPRRLSWAKSINNYSKNASIKEPWKTNFIRLCKTKEFQNIQILFAENKLNEAVVLCDKFSISSVRALSLMFDISVQNGSISNTTRNRIFALKTQKQIELKRDLTEKEFLAIIAIERAKDSNPRWANDVKIRKLCIVNGKGTVHGEFYDLNAFGLNDSPFLIKI